MKPPTIRLLAAAAALILLPAPRGISAAERLKYYLDLYGRVSDPNIVVVWPKEVDDVLVNPGMGWVTSYSFNSDKKNRNYPKASVAYFAWYWEQLVAAPSKIDLRPIDRALARAKAEGQALILHIAPYGAGGPSKGSAPPWLRKMGCAGKAGKYPGRPWWGLIWQPDHADPIFQSQMGKLVAALGKRYDGHPCLDHVNIASMGHWGEWHTAPMPAPPLSAQKKIIDMYFNAFRKTKLAMLVGGQAYARALAYAVSRGAGVFAASVDSPGYTGPHGFYYFERLEAAKATEAWKAAPISFEMCTPLSAWLKAPQGHPDFRYTFAQALKMHVSTINGGSHPIPPQMRRIVDDFSRKMGYRIVLRQLAHRRTARPGEEFPVEMKWENIGVAPCYRPYPLAVQLRSRAGEVVCRVQSAADLRTWLPSSERYRPYEVRETLKLPRALSPGAYDLRVAFLGPDGKAVLKLGIAGRGDDGWYTVSQVAVVKPGTR